MKNEQKVFSVTEISSVIKNAVENINKVCVTGEISGFKRHSSGHCYFALKDESAVLDAVMWRGSASKISAPITEGLNVVCSGVLTIFQGRSKYQLIADSLQAIGDGSLNIAFEALKSKLAAEGLFSSERKRPLPFLCVNVALITSPTGAVIQDILHRFKDRLNPNVMLYPVKVQGEGAETEIVKAIEFFNQLTESELQSLSFKKPDVIIVARGGGSKEDLQPFNTEIVTRAAANSKIPLISAVGHETDITLIDFAADLRAPTPTAAAEITTKVKSELLYALSEYQARTNQALLSSFSRLKEKLSFQGKSFSRTPDALMQKSQKADLLFNLFYEKFSAYFTKKKHQIALLFGAFHPDLIMRNLTRNREKFNFLMKQKDYALETAINRHKQNLTIKREKIDYLSNSAQKNLLSALQNKRIALENYGDLMESLSYKSALKRGFAVIHGKDGIISDKNQIILEKDFKIEVRNGVIPVQIKK